MIFIHGLGGDAFATWRDGNDDSNSWPHWLGQEFAETGVWSLGYSASPTKWTRFRGWFSKSQRNAGYSMALPDRALQVLDLFAQRGIGPRPILFICHSLGGLVAKQILRKAFDATDPLKRQVATNTRAVLFLATPHAGATLASLVSAFRTVFRATVSIEDLRAHDAHLRDLFDWYRIHAVELGIETFTYYELRGIKGVVPIVNPTSAHPGVGADPVGLDEDHLSIAKPRRRDAQVCGAARSLLRNQVLSPHHALSLQTKTEHTSLPPMPQELIIRIDTTAVGGTDARRIPRELPPPAEVFFGRRAELKKLTERLRGGRNTAVVGPAGLGKTALAADAVRAVVGDAVESLASSPFPDGVVFLDLYTFRGQAELTWNTLANKLAGAGFMERSPARARATEACRTRRALIVIEGGEEADGKDGRSNLKELLGVLSGENRWLLLTRLSTQAAPAESVELAAALQPEDAANLLDSLAQGRVTAAVRDRVLELLEGHPLALTWAGNLLARDDDDPTRLLGDWQAGKLPRLSDPTQAEHTLEWLFNRSVRGLNDSAREVLAAAGLMARSPFPLAAMAAALSESSPHGEETARDALRVLVQRGLLRRSVEADHWQFTHVLGYRFARKETGSDPDLRERLGNWFDRRLRMLLLANTAGDGPTSLTHALEHAAALLRADDDQRLWVPLANYALHDGCDRLVALGRLGLVTLALGAVAGWLERFGANKAQEPYWLRERSELLDRQGSVLGAQGDLGGALAAHREAETILRRLAATDPSNSAWQRDLGVSHNKVGEVLSAQGDLAGAQVAYRDSLAVMQRLSGADPSNAGWQRDLSVIYGNVGEVLRAQGDLAGAQAAYRESLARIQRLARADPSNAGWQRDLSASHNSVGDVLSAQGDLAGALAAYKESLAVMQRLAAADPSNAGWQRDLCVSHNSLGDVLSEQGDLAGALAAYGRSETILEGLAAEDPSNAGWLRDLCVSHNKVANVLTALGDLSGALAVDRESLAAMQRLTEADPSNAGWQRDLGVSHNNVGDVLSAQGDLAGALAAYRETETILQRLAAADPSNSDWQRDLCVSHSKVGSVLGRQGDLAGALAAHREALAVRRRLAAADPSNAVWQRDLSVSLTQMAAFHEQQGNRTEALRFAEESLEIDERLAVLDPTNATWREDVAVSRNLVARLRG